MEDKIEEGDRLVLDYNKDTRTAYSQRIEAVKYSDNQVTLKFKLKGYHKEHTYSLEEVQRLIIR